MGEGHSRESWEWRRGGHKVKPGYINGHFGVPDGPPFGVVERKRRPELRLSVHHHFADLNNTATPHDVAATIFNLHHVS